MPIDVFAISHRLTSLVAWVERLFGEELPHHVHNATSRAVTLVRSRLVAVSCISGIHSLSFGQDDVIVFLAALIFKSRDAIAAV